MDPIGTREVFGVIHTMAERGMTVVLAEHKVEWIAQFADRVIALKDGQILLDGTPSEVLTSPLLPENGFGVSRYTLVARQAQKQGLWKKRLCSHSRGAVGFRSPLPRANSGVRRT
jgi:energy-coupling factor transporter ATP-binding protein EcfA2